MRFIPAPAGNSLGIGLPELEGAVHPRACGEQIHLHAGPDGPAGSSPRLRGTEAVGGVEDLVHRFIPAPAGNSPPPTTKSCGPSVHPRACGEQVSRRPGES